MLWKVLRKYVFGQDEVIFTEFLVIWWFPCCSCWSLNTDIRIISHAFNLVVWSLYKILSIDADFYFSNFACDSSKSWFWLVFVHFYISQRVLMAASDFSLYSWYLPFLSLKSANIHTKKNLERFMAVLRYLKKQKH